MRLLPVMIVLALTTSGCAMRAADTPTTANFFLAEKTGLGDCFTRIIEGTVYDQICVKGDIVRYSPTVSAGVPEMPIYVQALFDTIPPSGGIGPPK